MIECILENMGDLILPVTIIVLVALAFYTFIFTLVVMCLVSVTRYFGTAGKEQKLIRMEVGKIAEEVHLLRHELKGNKDNGSSMD
jgi:hypothetical protein